MAQSKEWYCREGPGPASLPSLSTLFPEPSTKGHYSSGTWMLPVLQTQPQPLQAELLSWFLLLLRQGVLAGACQAQVGTGQ